MASNKFIEHKGKKILHMDFSYSKIEEVMAAIDEASSIIEKEAANSVLGLVDVSNSTFDANLADRLKTFSLHNKPYMKVTAVVGVHKIKKIIFMAVMTFTNRKNMVIKDTIEEANDWLAAQ